MTPAYRPGDRVVILPVLYGVPVPYTKWHTPQLVHPKRGDVVLLLNPKIASQKLYLRIIEAGSKFLTGQRYTPFASEGAVPDSHYLLRRIIAMPGDEVLIDGGGVRVKPHGNTSFMTEEQLFPIHVEITRPWRSDRWDSSRPFTGEEVHLLLAEEEYFVLSDDRSILEDSRTWGVIDVDLIRGRVSGRYYRASGDQSE
jgi:signal peptidase I